MNPYTQAARLTLRDNGGTFTRDGVPVETHYLRGYMVGGVVPTAVVAAFDTDYIAHCIAAFVAGHAATFNADPSLFVGTWKNTGNIYIDVVEFVGNLNAALALARERGELAIWDCYNGNEVTV